MRAAIYARVSTERQEREQTIASQLTALHQWVHLHQHSLRPTHIYRDEGYSGARLDRPGLDALRDAAADGAIDVVAVLHPDRLARKYAYQVVLLEELRRNGVEVVFLQHPISDDPNDQLLLQIQGAIAEYERALLRERFRRGKLQKARAGNWIGGKAPYGYRYIAKQEDVPGHLVVDDLEADFVRMLFRWLIDEQMTIRQILKRLNAGPWTPRSGKQVWSSSVVHHILSDPVYTGTAYTNRYRFVPPKKPRVTPRAHAAENTCRQPRPREDWIPIPVPAIIAQETFDLAQAQLVRNAALSFRNNTKYSYLLRCLLTCQTCGLAMNGTTYKATTTQPARHYYECRGKDRILSARETICPQRRAKGEELDAAVWEHVCALLQDPERLIAQFEHFAALAVTGGEQEQAAAHKLEANIKRLEREEQRLLDAYQAEVISLEELRERRHHLTERRRAVLAQQEQQVQLRREAAQAHQVLTDVRAFCERIRTRLNAASFEEKQAILQLVVERIIVGEDTLEIRHVIPLRGVPQEPGGRVPPPPGLRSDGVELAALPRHAAEDRQPRRLQAAMGITDQQLYPAQPALDQALQEHPPVHLLFRQRHRDAQYRPFAGRVDAARNQHRRIPHLPILPHLLVACIQIDIGIRAQRPRAPRLQYRIELSRCPAHLRRTDLEAAQLLGDRRDFAGRDALHIHFGQRQLQCPLGADAFLQALRIETTFAHLRDGNGERPEAGLEGLVLEAVGVRLALSTALIRPGADELLPLEQHGRVEQQAQRIRESGEATLGDLVEQLVR